MTCSAGQPISPPTERGDPRRSTGEFRETPLSAEQTGSQAAPWVSIAHGDRCWPPGSLTAPGQGPQASVGLAFVTVAAATTNAYIGIMDDGEASEDALKIGRLTRRAQFIAVAGSGRRAATPGLVLQIRPHDGRQAPNDGEGTVRVGVTASRKVGKAVSRNRARRRLRAVASAVLPHHAQPGFDLVLIARQEGTNARPFVALKADLKRALRRVGVYRPHAMAVSGGEAEHVR